MAGSLSNFAEDEFNDHWLKVDAGMIQPAGLFIALSIADPLDTGAGIAEPVGGAYARIQFETWIAAASRRSGNSGIIQFAIATGAWGALTHWAIFDAVTGGNMLLHGDLTTTVNINVGNRFEFANDTLRPTVAAGGWSDFLAHACLDHILLTAAYTQPVALYVAGVTVAVADGDTGSTITEPVAGAYARVNFEDWIASSGGASSNNTTITFPTATASWGDVIGCPILDAVTAGNLLEHAAVDVSQVIDIDEILTFDPGAFDITLD